MVNRNNIIILAIATIFVVPLSVSACDPCTLYNVARLQGNQSGRWSISISEQYTDFDKSDGQSEEVPKNNELTRSYTNTQISLEYGMLDWLGLQATVPIVYRSYDRIENYRTKTDSETGVGDVVLATNITPFCIYKPELTLVTNIFAGVKFPTGDTGSLSEVESERIAVSRHHPITTNGSGRALSIGSGSYDFPIGSSIFLRHKRLMFLASAQYTIRTEGDFNYEYADDFVWDIGPGVYLLSSHNNSLAARLVLAGEEKGSDKRNGSIQSDTELSNYYMGPQLLFTIGDNWAGEVGFDMLVDGKQSGSVESDYRIKSALTYSF